VHVERLDLRRPSMEHLRLSAMMAHVEERIGGERDRAVLMGSSLGGLTMARVAESDPRATALILLAPAFRLAERWRARLGGEELAAWERDGWLEVDDHASKGRTRVDFGFFEELARIDDARVPYPDVRVPTLIVHGVRDDVVDIEGSRVFASGRPHVRLVEVDDGHELGASVGFICDESVKFLSIWLNAGSSHVSLDA
jgi:pimeloyl-ACP methyl ester carboxylesterase